MNGDQEFDIVFDNAMLNEHSDDDDELDDSLAFHSRSIDDRRISGGRSERSRDHPRHFSMILVNENETRTSNFDSISSPPSSSSATSQRTKDIFYCKNYFDFDDILAQTVRLPVKFQRTIPNLGFLDPSFANLHDEGDDENQQESSSSTKKTPAITKGTKLELPIWLVKELNGDNAVKVNLPKEGRGGSTSIKDETINDLNEFVARLDEWELELLDTGRKIVTEIRRWENRDSTKIRPNEMVVNLKKRKVLLEQQQRLSQNSTLNGTSSSR
ncbi:hypothetical protein SSS_06012 [Sarcoptes scabiei]|uniref:DNA replication complex GINS protein PSF3 n=1 Tax=Sarcoptes scabiei TaxID=52283 RepID=A0A834R374_SARSC|nr:hypothetical protein SSS_06012 [Sarcoptes scabiei]